MAVKLFNSQNVDIDVKIESHVKGGKKPGTGFLLPSKYILRFVDADNTKMNLIKSGERYLLISDDAPTTNVEVVNINLDTFEVWTCN
jgi:hypothetical protein